MTDTEKPALSDMEKFGRDAEVEAAKASLLRTAQLSCPGKELACIRFWLDGTRTQHEAAPDAVDADDRVHLDALESLVSDLEREEKQP